MQGGDGYQTDVEDVKTASRQLVDAAHAARLATVDFRGRSDLNHAIPFDDYIGDDRKSDPPPEDDGGNWVDDAVDTVSGWVEDAVDYVKDAFAPGAVTNIDAMGKGVVAAIKGPYAKAVSALDSLSNQVGQQLTQLSGKLAEGAATYQGDDTSNAENFGAQEDGMERGGGGTHG